jgi:hypothetical protein
VIIGLPSYEERSGRNPAVGFGDWPFLLLKYRLFSANEENGNYCLTPLVAFTAPTGSNAFSTKNFGSLTSGSIFKRKLQFQQNILKQAAWRLLHTL